MKQAQKLVTPVLEAFAQNAKRGFASQRFAARASEEVVAVDNAARKGCDGVLEVSRGLAAGACKQDQRPATCSGCYGSHLGHPAASTLKQLG